jgi:hypothetical protein
MGLSRSYDLDCRFSILTGVHFIYFFGCFFNWIFFLVGLCYFFDLLSMKLSRSHNPDRRCGRLTWVDRFIFFCPFLIDFFSISPSSNSIFFLFNFFFLILGYLEIGHHNVFFYFLFVLLSLSHGFSFFSLDFNLQY